MKREKDVKSNYYAILNITTTRSEEEFDTGYQGKAQ